jgi:hypothetical protein
MVGRNGVFYDRRGRDWDATVVRLLEHPISIRQAFWMPYKKIGRLIGDAVERIEGDANKGVMDKAQAQVASSAQAVQAGKPGEKPRIDTGMLAAIGIAATSLVSAISGIAAAVFGLPLWKVPFVVAGVVLAISGPAMVIAYLKLRQRTLGPVLEANGWAINGRVKINLPLGNSLTGTKALPPNAHRRYDDPFEDRSAARRRRQFILCCILAAALAAGAVAWLGWWPAIEQWFRDLFSGAAPAAAPMAEKK